MCLIAKSEVCALWWQLVGCSVAYADHVANTSALSFSDVRAIGIADARSHLAAEPCAVARADDQPTIISTDGSPDRSTYRGTTRPCMCSAAVRVLERSWRYCQQCCQACSGYVLGLRALASANA